MLRLYGAEFKRVSRIYKYKCKRLKGWMQKKIEDRLAVAVTIFFYQTNFVGHGLW